MRVLFILQDTRLHERLGIMTLSSILKQQGHVVNLFITKTMRKDACLAEIRKRAPDILAYSIVTGEQNYYLAFNRYIKEHYHCFSVFGGPHPTFSPDMINQTGVDAICRGEGDLYFPQLLVAMEEGGDFYQTPNFWIKRPDGRIVKNEIGPLVNDLNALPFPDRKILYDADPALRFKGNKLFMTMRGCPYQCSYCFNHSYNQLVKNKGAILRYRSVDNVIAEIKRVKAEYFLDRVFIDDDTFLIKPDGWLEAFAERYPDEVGVPITCNIRGNLADVKNVALLEKMGCKHVFIGVDPPHQDISVRILNRHITPDQTMNACAMLHRHNIKIMTQSILGLPVDNPLETDLATLDFNIKLKPDFAMTHLLYPYDGTDIKRIAVQNNMFDPDHEKNTAENQTQSALTFNSPAEKRKITNLSKLFGVIVQFPFLRPLTPLLISLPLTYLYTLLFYGLFGCKLIRHSNRKIVSQVVRSYLPFYVKLVRQSAENKS